MRQKLAQLEAKKAEEDAAAGGGSDVGGGSDTVTAEQIAEIVARWTSIPVTRLMSTEKEKLLRVSWTPPLHITRRHGVLTSFITDGEDSLRGRRWSTGGCEGRSERNPFVKERIVERPATDRKLLVCWTVWHWKDTTEQDCK